MTAETWNTSVTRLSPKERECLRLVGENRSSKEIARLLGISHTSVDTHVRRSLAKLDLRDRAEAARRLALLEAPKPAPVAARPGEPQTLWRSLLPPLDGLGLGRRLVLVGGASAAMAMAFGILLNILRIF